MLRVLPLIVLLVVAACSKSSPPAGGDQTTAAKTQGTRAAAAPEGAVPPVPEAATKPVPARLPDVIARVNGEVIDRAELQKAIESVEAQNGSPVPADQRDRVYRGVLDQIIGYRLLLQEAKARNITVPDVDLEARLAQIRSQFPSEDAFKQTLDQQKATLDQLRADTRSQMLVARILQTEVEPKVVVGPEQVTGFYQSNPSEFRQGERVRASHILIAFPQGADAAARQAARRKAEAVLKDVKAGKDFAALATQHSQDEGSAQRGGDLNYFERGQMVGPFDQAAFAITPGQTSGLVETPFGLHIIKVTDKQPSRTVPIDEVRAQIQQFLENQAREEATQAFVEALKARGKVEILI